MRGSGTGYRISKPVSLSCVNRKSSANKFDLGGPDAAQPLRRRRSGNPSTYGGITTRARASRSLAKIMGPRDLLTAGTGRVGGQLAMGDYPFDDRSPKILSVGIGTSELAAIKAAWRMAKP